MMRQQIDLADDGSLSINPDFFVDFSALPGKPRAHKIDSEVAM
jgi:hypothetical protein